MEEYQGKHEAAVPADENGTPPGISPVARTRIYISALVAEVVTMLVCGFGVIFGFMTGEQALQVGGLVAGAVGLLSTGLAVGYRPTRDGAIR